MKRKEKSLPMSRRANDYSPLRRILILFIAFNPVNRVQNGKDAIKRDHFRKTITELLKQSQNRQPSSGPAKLSTQNARRSCRDKACLVPGGSFMIGNETHGDKSVNRKMKDAAKLQR